MLTKDTRLCRTRWIILIVFFLLYFRRDFNCLILNSNPKGLLFNLHICIPHFRHSLDFRHRNNRSRGGGPCGCRRIQPFHGEPHPGPACRLNRCWCHSLHRGLPGLFRCRQGTTFDPFECGYFHQKNMPPITVLNSLQYASPSSS